MNRGNAWNLIYKMLRELEAGDAETSELFAACLFVLNYIALRTGCSEELLITMVRQRYAMMKEASKLDTYIIEEEGEA